MSLKKSYPAYNGFNHVEPSTHLEQVLILTSFLIPGLGLAAEGCMTKILSAISKLGNAAKFISKHCERIQCPNCYQWWISQRAFKLAVLIECYAEYKKERPIGVVCSVHPDEVKTWTWKDYGNFIRKCYTRLYKLDVIGGVRFFHSFRIKKDIQTQLRALGAKDSGGFWKMIRENILNLPSWFLYVTLSPHIHAIGFSSWMKENITKDIIIRKYAVFDTITDTVVHTRYLLSHCGILVNGENEPASPFGALHGWKPEGYLTPEKILSIKNQVAEAMDLRYDRVADMIIPTDIEDDKHEWIPIYEFADYSNEQQEFIGAFISSIPDADNRSFVNELVSMYNDRRIDTSLNKHKRHVFIDDLIEVPKNFKIIVMD